MPISLNIGLMALRRFTYSLLCVLLRWLRGWWEWCTCTNVGIDNTQDLLIEWSSCMTTSFQIIQASDSGSLELLDLSLYHCKLHVSWFLVGNVCRNHFVTIFSVWFICRIAWKNTCKTFWKCYNSIVEFYIYLTPLKAEVFRLGNRGQKCQ